jgi:hypothetical protein
LRFYFHYTSKLKFLKLISANSYDIDKDTIDKDTIDKDSIDKDIIDKDTIDKDTELKPWREKDILLDLMRKFSWQNHACAHSRTTNNVLTVWCLIKVTVFLLIIRIYFHGSCERKIRTCLN